MYLIIGASGFLGRYCIKNVLEDTNEKIIATYSKETTPSYQNARVEWISLDVCDITALEKLADRIDNDTKIIYLAAFHHPDRVEEFPELAWKINIIALAYAVNVFGKAKCLYYSSTDTVYGEGAKDKKFIETDPYAPVNLYGKHKALAEQICLTKGFNVVRFPFIFGPSLVEGRPHFFDNIKADLEKGQFVEMFSDSYRSTLSFNQCAHYLVALIEKFGACPEKIVNIAGDDVMSKYDAAIVLAKKYGLDTNLVKPISITQNTGIFKAKRATSGTIDNTRLKNLLNIKEIHLEV
jgi:dTDP-4-dehydrorhamnose reductase